MKNLQHILLALFAFVYLDGYAQEQHGGVPMMFTTEKSNSFGGLQKSGVLNIKKKQYAEINNQKEKIKADELTSFYGYGKDKLYGVGVPVNIDFKESATMKLLGDSGKLYLLELTSPTAYALQVYFDAFKIPKGSRMFIYDRDRTMFLGSFTHENNSDNKRFGTQFIKGNSLIIEYYEPNQVEFDSELHVENLVHTFDILESGPFSPGGSGDCQINVNCPEGYGWDREKRSVAIIIGYFGVPEYNASIGYYGWGTGTVINNTLQDGTPYFLTAKHLVEGIEEMQLVSDWIFLFNHETETCDEDGSLVSSLMRKSVYGATMLASDGADSPTTDYMLLRLNTSLSTLTAYDVVYAGWEADGNKAVASPFFVGIHHPKGDVKKISRSINPIISVANNGVAGTLWRVRWNGVGVMTDASSGSPLFNSDHKIIGHLYRGNSSCDNPLGYDFYGKFSDSYIRGNFSTWLDPYNTGATSMGPYNPSGINEHCYNGVQDGNETGIDCGGTCPPCDWVSDNWSAVHCSNGVKDGNETGVDCGGSCKPCGGVTICSNCKKDGDETGIDCGGSCKPCESFCFGSEKTYTNSNIPSLTSVSNSINAKNVHINNREISFRARDKIKIEGPFSAGVGSSLKLYTGVGVCDCMPVCPIQIPNIFTPNGDGSNDQLVAVATGYNRFEVVIVDRSSSRIIHRASGDVVLYGSSYLAWLWDGAGAVNRGVYYVHATFYSDCLNISQGATMSVTVWK